MSANPQRGWSLAEVTSGAIALFLFTVSVFGKFMGPSPSMSVEKGNIFKCVTNCRQIILALRLYAVDHDGRYPDADVPEARDSNTVFRRLIAAGTVGDERLFGGYSSPYAPDGELGGAPEYSRAAEPGENHWAMTKGLSGDIRGTVPFVFENPGEATWPPTWRADISTVARKGRAWKGGRIIVGSQDTSVELMKLDSPTGNRVSLKPVEPRGENLFEQHMHKPDGTQYALLDAAPEPGYE
jgi:hypothetical protein